MRPPLLLAILAMPLVTPADPRVSLDFRKASVPAERLQAEILRQASAKVAPPSLTIRNANVVGALDVADWSVPYILRFSDCTFQGDVDFSQFSTERSLIFDGCTFRGGADLSELHIGRDFHADGCRFMGTKATSARRDNDPTTFIHSLIGDDFSLNGSDFKGSVNMRHLNVGRDLYLQDTAYHGGEPDPDGDPGDIYLVKLEGTQIGHFLRIDRILDDNPSTRIAINDCNFSGVFAQTKKNNTEAKEEGLMLKMLEDMPYRAQSYDLIEREFKRRGRQDLADDVYIHGQDRETAESRGFAKIRGLTLKYVAGYGRKPAQAFAWCLVAVVVGALVFVREEGGSGRKRYLRSFWYSLDLFVPIVSVSGKEPEPPEGAFARSYVRVHRLLGWLLLPIALAAISGIVGKE